MRKNVREGVNHNPVVTHALLATKLHTCCPMTTCCRRSLTSLKQSSWS